MADTTNPLPSIIEPVIDRNRRWSPIWYRWIKPLLETVKESAGRVQETIDNIAGKWALSINDDGRVLGAITLDGSIPALTTFAVLADRFIIVHPSENGTTIQAFIVGQVDGINTVGINGDLIVDGTILARHIDVVSLSAITADVGLLTAGRIESTSGDSYIDLDDGSFQFAVEVP